MILSKKLPRKLLGKYRSVKLTTFYLVCKADLLFVETRSAPGTAAFTNISLFIKILEHFLLSSVNELQSNTNKMQSAFSMKISTLDSKLRYF